MLENVFCCCPSLRTCPRKKKRNHYNTLYYLSSFLKSAKTTAITSIVEGTLPVIEPTQDDQKKQSITMASMQFSILHTNTTTWCSLKKSFLIWRRDNEKKKPNQTLEQTASLPGKQLFSLGRQATIQSTQGGFQIVFKPCRELL